MPFFIVRKERVFSRILFSQKVVYIPRTVQLHEFSLKTPIENAEVWVFIQESFLTRKGEI